LRGGKKGAVEQTNLGLDLGEEPAYTALLFFNQNKKMEFQFMSKNTTQDQACCCTKTTRRICDVEKCHEKERG